MIIAIDFDNTIAITRYPKIIAAVPNVEEAIKEIARFNTLILWTCREGSRLVDAIDYLHEIGIRHYFSEINENVADEVKQWGTDPRKIGADLFIDDKAVGCPKKNGFVDWKKIVEEIKDIEP